jgi:hypothetical protein
MPNYDYYELFGDTQAGIMGALETAVTEAHAWSFLRHWEPEWEMVPLPSIEQRLPNRDAYDEDVYNECVDIIWTIARIGWHEFRESYIEENPPCTCRRRAGKLAGYCWPRNDDEDIQPMCEEIRDYRRLFQDNERVTRLNHLDNVITEQGDWEYWAIEDIDNWRPRANTYGIEGITQEDIQIMSGIAAQGWDEFVRLRDAHIHRIRAQMPEVD